jgi:hypothetical protein
MRIVRPHFLRHQQDPPQRMPLVHLRSLLISVNNPAPAPQRKVIAPQENSINHDF